ncbi:MAG TPA: xanthine dehydrogenase family protein molybdopterin-binding subunit [Streptosporangiaceae bacterium]
MNRIEGRDKVTGRATYAVEYAVEGTAYAHIVGSTVARGRIRAIDTAEAYATPGVLDVLTYANAPETAVDNPELALFQSRDIAYRGQIVAAVIAESAEAARAGAAAVRVAYDAEPHDVTLRADHPGLYVPDKVNPSFPATTERGDVAAGLAEAAATVDVTYATPAEHNNPMEPHGALAAWDGDRLTVYDSTQGASTDRATIANVLRMPPERVRVVSPHVGGGFGSKGTTRAPAVLAALAARVAGRPVKIAITRQQMFDITGYRTPTVQRLRLGADTGGRLTALDHDVVEQSSTLVEFAEQAAVPSRMMYAAPALRTCHQLARLDVATPSWMRAPGECPGMYALESAMDELASALDMDPVELRIVNEPAYDQETGLPFSSRNLVACLREGARRFGWAGRDPAPGVRRDGRWLVGTGVAASTYPARRRPSRATATATGDGYVVRIAAADIGTGARTALAVIAAEALETTRDRVHVEVGDSDLPEASLAGGSMGTSSWGSAVVRACEDLRKNGGTGAADTADEIAGDTGFARHAFGAQFAEVRVDPGTGELRVARLLGVFAAGRIIDPVLARSQLIGGMTMGIGMALMEETRPDAEFGGWVNRDLAQYHVATCTDVHDVDAVWVDEDDPHLNPMGSKGIGEIGIVGTAAAIGNAVHHATGVRVRSLPITPPAIVG